MPSIWQHTPDLDQLNQTTHTLLGTIGIEFTEIGDNFIRARMPVDERTHQPFGILHGGASVALAETLGSTGAFHCIDPAHFQAVGIEVNANHVRSVRSGWVIGTTKPIHRGRTTQLWEIRITDEADKLVCIARITIAILEKTPTATP